jgi:hypothetical protein
MEGSGVASFMVEAFTPTAATVAALDRSLHEAAAALAAEGIAIRYVRSILVPDDDTCFYMVEATSEDAVRETLRRAGFEDARITRAIETAASEERDAT